MPLQKLHEKANKLNDAHAKVYGNNTPTDSKERESLAVELSKARDAFWNIAYHLPEPQVLQTSNSTQTAPRHTQG